MLTGFSLVRSSASGGPVQVAAAGLAVDQRALLAELLEALRSHGHAATAAEVGLGHLDDGHAAMAEELVVVGEDGGGKIPSQLTALALDQVELALELLPLDPVVLEVLLLRALALPGGIEARLGRLHRLARLIHGGVHGGDL